jgi:ankyrin repeat protein
MSSLLDSEDENERNCLMIASFYGHIKICIYLIDLIKKYRKKNKANILNKFDRYNNSAIILSCYNR